MPEDRKFTITVFAMTHTGMVRSGNEDSFLILNLSTADTWTAGEEIEDPPNHLTSFAQGYYGTILAVTDGMGGALAGEVASRLAVENVRDRLLELQRNPKYSILAFQERLRLSLEIANLSIHYQSLDHLEYTGMGATFTGAGINGRTAYFAQVGDSRAYIVRRDKVRQITRDQSLVGQLVEAGHITEEEALHHTYKNVILQALGAAPYINVAISKLKLYNSDMLIICSDGLSNKVRPDEILDVIDGADSLEESCEELINIANDRGGEDNITALVAQVANIVEGETGTLPEPETWNGEWVIETLPRDPNLPDEIEQALLGSEMDTLS